MILNQFYRYSTPDSKTSFTGTVPMTLTQFCRYSTADSKTSFTGTVPPILKPGLQAEFLLLFVWGN